MLQGSSGGIGLPYNVHHHTHAQEQDGKVVISKPVRPPPMKPSLQTKSSEEKLATAPKRPPPPKQLPPAGNKPPRPPLPTRNE